VEKLAQPAEQASAPRPDRPAPGPDRVPAAQDGALAGLARGRAMTARGPRPPRGRAGQSMHPAQVLQLQELAGNRAVTALLGHEPAPPPSTSLPALPRPAPTVAASEGRPAPVPVVQRGLWDRLKGGVRSLASGVASLAGGLKDRVLGTLAGWARRIPGYGLLCVVLGREVVTGAAVDRSPANLIGGLVGLIPGGQAIFENLQRSGAVQRAADWFGAAVTRLGLTWAAIRGLFSRAWDALGAGDLLDPAGAWAKIAGIFGPPLQRLRAFASAAAGKLLELVFEGGLSLAGGAGAQVMAIVRRAGSVLATIVRDPIRFAGNLVAAVRGGLGRFAANIGAHLRTGLFAWLTGALRGAVALPARLDWRGILGFILNLLGLTWTWVRTRLVRLLGEPTVRRLETAVSWVGAIVTGGLGVIADRILGFATGLIDTVIGGIRDWVARSVVGAAITRLIAMFNPAGAIIGAIIAVYNTIRFFIERAQQLGALARSVFDSIAAIAAGSLGNAITAVEQSMARALPVILGFLARLLGLGDLASPVRNVINRARALIDRALDKVISWIAGVARKLVGRGREPAGLPPPAGASAVGDPRRQLRAAVKDAYQLMDAPDATTASVRQGLDTIRGKHGLRSLEFVNVAGHNWRVIARINPELPSDSRKVPSPEERAAITTQAQRIAQLWHVNGTAESFRAAGRVARRELLLDPTSYERPGGMAGAPTVSVGDLVEATAVPGLQRIAAATGGLLLIKPTIFLSDAADQPIGGQVDEIDFLLLGPAEVRVVSAKTDRRQFAPGIDEQKLNLIRRVPDNPAAFQFVANYMGWREGARAALGPQTRGVVIRCDNVPTMRVTDFRSRYLNRERTRTIIVEPVHPKHQGEREAGGYTLRMDLADLVDIYIREIVRLL
jgi:hypothetical protein